jgi:hypothetical protein
MGVVRILDREVMQSELPLHAAQERHIRLVETNPDHVVRLAAPTRGFLNGDAGDALTVDIDAGRDDPIRADCRVGSNGFGCQIHGFRPSMLSVEPCFEATFFGEG